MSAIITSLAEQINRMASEASDIASTLSSYLTRMRTGIQEYKSNLDKLDIVLFKSFSSSTDGKNTVTPPVKLDQDGCHYLPAPSSDAPYISARYLAVAYCIAYVEYANQQVQSGSTPPSPPPFCSLTKNDNGTYSLNGLLDNSLDATQVPSYNPFAAVDLSKILSISLEWDSSSSSFVLKVDDADGNTWSSNTTYYKDSGGPIADKVLMNGSADFVSSLVINIDIPRVELSFSNTNYADALTAGLFMAVPDSAISQQAVMKEASGGAFAYGTLSAALYSDHSVGIAVAPVIDRYSYPMKRNIPELIKAVDGMLTSYAVEVYKPAVMVVAENELSSGANESSAIVAVLPIGLAECGSTSS